MLNIYVVYYVVIYKGYMKKYMVWYETLTIVAFKLIEFDSDWMLILDSTCILINLWVVNLNIRVKKSCEQQT